MNARPKLILALLFLAAWGGDESGNDNQTSSSVITYRLLEARQPFDRTGSRFGVSGPSPTRPPAVYTLRGTFEVVRNQPTSPNTRFSFRITRLEFSAGPYLIQGQGNVGTISVSTLHPASPLTMTARVTISGDDVELTGTGPPGSFTLDAPPRFQRVEIGYQRAVGLGYVGYGMTIFAVPEE